MNSFSFDPSFCHTLDCMILVHPDQYIANILPVDDFAGLTRFFDGILTGA